MDGRQAPEGEQPLAGAPAPRPLSRGRVRPGAPRVAALDALLRDVDALRTTLQTDLSLAAGALEAGEPHLAASVLDSDRLDVSDFAQRALGHLRALEAADLREAEAGAPAQVHLLPARAERTAKRGLPRRLTRLLPAAPLVAAAAALVGVFGVPGTTARVEPTTDVSGAVLSSWAELNRLSASDAPADEVQRAAQSLNADLASMVARAGGDPATARQALALLREAEAVLRRDDDAGEMEAVLQQSRVLAARLLAGLPPTLSDAVRPAHEVLPQASAPPLPRPVPHPERSAARPAPRRAEAVRPTPSAVPSPRPSTATSTSPTSEPSARPSPSTLLPPASRPPSLPTSFEPPLS